ncbi:MAG TPA: RNA methyltransferase [Terracidiphilus sp.]|nr:RNA methyltransferase [Terracidiphilus sp.]
MKELRRALANPSRGEPVGIEGPNLLYEATRARLRIHCVFVASEHDAEAIGPTLPAETEILLVPRELLDSALTTETPQPIAALVDAPVWSWDQILGPPAHARPLVVVLAGLQDPGNLGTIIRSAEAFGASGILCLPGTVHAWNSKTVRASAGSIFRIPILTADPEEAIARLRSSGIEVLVAAADSALAADRAHLAHPTAFLIGNEGNGVPVEIAALADGAVRIPCPGQVESLNAAVAASVLLYEAARQRATESANSAEADS